MATTRRFRSAALEVQTPPPPAAARKEMVWPETVAGKIEEVKYKVKQMELHKADMDHEIEMLEKVVEGMETEMDYELDLVLHCGDVEIMRRARQRCVPRASLSEVEERALRDIRDLAVSAITDYTANVGPLPVYDRPINPLSDTIRLPLPSGLTGASTSRHRLAQLEGGGDARRRSSGAGLPADARRRSSGAGLPAISN